MSEQATSTAKTYEGWLQSSTCRAVEEAGRTEGRQYGLAESKSRTLARLLNRQARQKFAAADAAGKETLDGLAQAFACEQLLDLGVRLLGAAGWSEWLAGVTAGPPAPGMPEYTRDLEIDLEPSGPSIDTHMKVAMKGGGSAKIGRAHV